MASAPSNKSTLASVGALVVVTLATGIVLWKLTRRSAAVAGNEASNKPVAATARAEPATTGVDAAAEAPQPPRYWSTRSADKDVTFESAVLRGLAEDGGLYVPVTIPSVPKETLEGKWATLEFAELAFQIMTKFVPAKECSAAKLKSLCDRSYGPNANFRDKAHTTPVVHLAKEKLEMLELFHGPTFAFKDVALQFLGNLFEHILSTKPGSRITVMGATSGDTGSSAIYGLRGKKGVRCFILFPEGGVSPIQEKQMTTVLDANVQCISVKGSFDDAQDIVKTGLMDEPFRAKHQLAAVNSINWARIMAQITYYFYTYFELCKRNPEVKSGKKQIVFVVPTGNFGDVLAGYYAKRMGLPCAKFVVATNENDILDRFFQTGVYEKSPKVRATITPSMDIGVSSNFERFLFHMHKDDHAKMSALMREFSATQRFKVDAVTMARCRATMTSARATESQVRETIKQVYESDKYVLDPHTAVGVAASRILRQSGELDDAKHVVVCVATAHWAKFSDAIAQSLGPAVLQQLTKTEFPPELAALDKMPTKKVTTDAKYEAVKSKVESLIAEMEAKGA